MWNKILCIITSCYYIINIKVIEKITGARTAARDNDENINLEDINKLPLPGFIRKDGNEEKVSQSILNKQFRWIM